MLMNERVRGGLAIFLAYVIWGAMPVYWKALKAIDSSEILGHRVVWAFLFTILLLAGQKKVRGVIRTLQNDRRLAATLTASGIIVTLNWYLYIWAVNHDRILEVSLGYFINPLISVIFGVIFFRERLRPLQWAAILLGAVGVGAEVVGLGRVPTIALGIAFSFGIYGLLRKKTDIDAVAGLFVETSVMTLPALLWLAHCQRSGVAHYPYGAGVNLLLVGAGVLSSIALILFAWGARRIRLSTVGLIQYTSPIMTFFLAVFVYREAINPTKLFSFALIWAAILLYTCDSLRRREQ